LVEDSLDQHKIRSDHMPDKAEDGADGQAPAHLWPETQRWLLSVLDGYFLEEHHVRLLTLAGEAWERNVEARNRLAQEGLTVEGRSGLKPHPCIAIERDAKAQFAALVKQLGLDDVGEPRTGPGRPPSGVGISWARLNGMPEPKRKGRQKRGESYA
jgi:phage terminase small subunit